MPEFKSKEEYEAWKEHQRRETKTNVDQPGTANVTGQSNDTLNERAIWDGHPEWTGYALLLLLCILFFLSGVMMAVSNKIYLNLFLSAVIFMAIAWSRISRHYRVTDQRVITMKGILTKATKEIDIKDIRSINVAQGMLQRLFGIGNIEFTSASGIVKEVTFLNVKNPEQLKEKIRQFKH